MAYRVIWAKIILLQYTFLDFIDGVSTTIIDCRTEEGQLKFIELFGYAKFKRLARYYKGA